MALDGQLCCTSQASGRGDQARPYRASAVGSRWGHNSPPGSLTQHGPQRWAGWNIGPALHSRHRGSMARSRGLSSPGSYQRSESATTVKSPGSAGHAGRDLAPFSRSTRTTSSANWPAGSPRHAGLTPRPASARAGDAWCECWQPRGSRMGVPVVEVEAGKRPPSVPNWQPAHGDLAADRRRLTL
jgi:hypothetical protein